VEDRALFGYSIITTREATARIESNQWARPYKCSHTYVAIHL
jgi:hypothetical protein